MVGVPDDSDLERLGVYEPSAPGADDRLRLLRRLVQLGASADELVRASRLDGLGTLSLDLSTRPPGETHDLDSFAEGSGLDAGLVRRLWRALGLPVSEAYPPLVTPDAAEAIGVLVGLSDIVGEESALAVARVVGSSTARVAEAVAEALRIAVEVPSLEAGRTYSEVVEEYSTTGHELLPSFLGAVNAAFRRHLVLTGYQLWSTDEERAAVTLERTVGFVDMVGSTEAQRAGSIAALARTVRQFEELVWDVVAGAGGRVVKLIGDEAMFVVEDPGVGCRVALDLIEISPYPVRIGLAAGAVVALYGDYYGETVNLAARLVGVAEPSSVVVSESVRNAAGDAFAFRPLPARPLKGFSHPVRTFGLGGTSPP
jgi:adenylate cyclase